MNNINLEYYTNRIFNLVGIICGNLVQTCDYRRLPEEEDKLVINLAIDLKFKCFDLISYLDPKFDFSFDLSRISNFVTSSAESEQDRLDNNKQDRLDNLDAYCSKLQEVFMNLHRLYVDKPEVSKKTACAHVSLAHVYDYLNKKIKE